MTIGDRIKMRRLELGYTQDELARMLGYTSRSSINKIELDAQGLPQSKIVQIAKILQVSPAYLMGWEDEADLKLSCVEQDIIRRYRNADFVTRGMVLRALELDVKYKKEDASDLSTEV